VQPSAITSKGNMVSKRNWIELAVRVSHIEAFRVSLEAETINGTEADVSLKVVSPDDNLNGGVATRSLSLLGSEWDATT